MNIGPTIAERSKEERDKEKIEKNDSYRNIERVGFQALWRPLWTGLTETIGNGLNDDPLRKGEHKFAFLCALSEKDYFIQLPLSGLKSRPF